MVFSSIIFIFYFIPIFFIFYFIADKRYKNALILAGSILFYAWGGTTLYFCYTWHYCYRLLHCEVDVGNRNKQETQIAAGYFLIHKSRITFLLQIQ